MTLIQRVPSSVLRELVGLTSRVLSSLNYGRAASVAATALHRRSRRMTCSKERQQTMSVLGWSCLPGSEPARRSRFVPTHLIPVLIVSHKDMNLGTQRQDRS